MGERLAQLAQWMEAEEDEHLTSRIDPLVDLGAIERMGRGRGVRYLLSGRFYRTLGRQGVYTRKRGLDRDTNKALLLQHLERSQESGSPLSELNEVLPALSAKQIQHLLAEMKAEAQVHVRGMTKGARWYLGPGVDHAGEP